MSCLLRSLVVLPLAIFLILPANRVHANTNRLALVIGNSTYQNAPLKNPSNDATDMAVMLKRLDFKVTLKTNATRRTMLSSIIAFGKQLRDGGVGLFYYAGHGLQVQGHNYLIPIDARIDSESDVEYEAVDAGRVLGKMEDAGNGLNIIILDACRNNPYSRSFRSGSTGLAKMDAPTGSILAFSTSPGSVAADGSGRNGLYTSKLLKHMASPGLNIEKVFKKVRIDVARSSGKKQTPWESSSLMGDFYFNAGKNETSQQIRAVSVQKRQGPQNLNAEEEMWEAVKTSDSIEDYDIFLDEYPDSRFSSTARLKIQQLKRKQNAKQFQAAVASSITSPNDPASVDHSLKLQHNLFKMALFASHIPGYRSNVEITTALSTFLGRNPDFKLSYSYYQMGSLNSRDSIAKGILNEQNKELLWLKEGIFSNKRPNEKFIYEIGQKINVDFVLLFNIPNPEVKAQCISTIEIYVLDINNEKMLTGKSHPECFNENREIAKTIESVLSKLVSFSG